MAGVFQTAISLSHAAFSAVLNGSHAGMPVTQLSLSQRRSEMEVRKRGTIWAGLSKVGEADSAVISCTKPALFMTHNKRRSPRFI